MPVARIAQITDCHVVVAGDVMADRIDSDTRLAAAIDRISELDPLPDLVVGTGDLVNDARADQYDRLVEVLAALTVPFLAVPGNHDDRSELRSRFADLPTGGADQPIDHVVDVGDALRIVALDTTRPGVPEGRLEPGQLAWLDTTLAEMPERPTLVAQHHPPFHCGIEWMDRFRLDSIEGERRVLARHHHVRAVISGHYHRATTVTLDTTTAWCAPSTAAQVDLTAPDVTYTDEAPAFLLHDLMADGTLRTHVVHVETGARWRPAWSLAADA